MQVLCLRNVAKLPGILTNVTKPAGINNAVFRVDCSFNCADWYNQMHISGYKIFITVR